MLAAVFCVFLFSLTAPLTRLAALETDPVSIIFIRILGAGIVCLLFVILDKWIPPKKIWPGLIATTLGSVIGFNSLMAFGLHEVPAGHAAVALAGLPMATSVYSTLRDQLRPGIKFWIYSSFGMLLSFSFFFILNVEDILEGDIFLILAVFAAAFGYVEGGRVSRIYGGPRTMSWAVILTLPFILPSAFIYFSNVGETFNLSNKAWIAVSYLAFVSQSLGMFLWFKVLASGPMERIAQVQLIQPFFTLMMSIVLLDERVNSLTWIIAFLVAVCVFGSNKEKNIVRT